MDWWDGIAAERFWLETTDRPTEGIGTNLLTWQGDVNGQPVWHYRTLPKLRAGDVVFHYDLGLRAITHRSRATGTWWTDEDDDRRPVFQHDLDDAMQLDDPVALEDIEREDKRIRAVIAALDEAHGRPLYLPFLLPTVGPVRLNQAYVSKLPADIVALFLSLGDGGTSPPVSEIGEEYRPADEEAATSDLDPFEVDPAVIERGVQGHARTQNALADHLRAQGLDPRSPTPEEPNYDLAWSLGGTTFVAEIKSLTAANEERQLRLGLGQVLRYRHVLGSGGAPVRAVLVAEREPTDTTWSGLCRDLGVVLTWGPRFRDLPT